MEFKAFKMDGLGNDFVIIETKKRNPISISKEKIIELGKRDNICLLYTSDAADE